MPDSTPQPGGVSAGGEVAGAGQHTMQKKKRNNKEWGRKTSNHCAVSSRGSLGRVARLLCQGMPPPACQACSRRSS